MKKLLGILAGLAVLAFGGTVFACSFDYADATGYFNKYVYAQDPTWNRLGTSWTGEADADAVSGNMDLDDGVFWSINGGGYGHDDITLGDIVTFQFILSKVEWGRHYADFLKVWIDWNNDKDFWDADEMVYKSAYYFTPNTAPDHSSTQFLDQNYHNPVIVATYYFETTFDSIEAGDYWLRARVACNADAGTLAGFSPMGSYYQGEIEDWKLTVKQPVPEPSTILILGSGLIALAGFRRKSKKR